MCEKANLFHTTFTKDHIIKEINILNGLKEKEEYIKLPILCKQHIKEIKIINCSCFEIVCNLCITIGKHKKCNGNGNGNGNGNKYELNINNMKILLNNK